MQKKVLAINDLSSFGKCSLTAAIPVISALKVQCCPLPTSVLSSQTEFEKYAIHDISDHMNEFSNVWKELNFDFDLIYTGFMSNRLQIDETVKLIEKFPNSKLLVDPVMADSGELYPCFTIDIVKEQKKLISISDIITPNITEALLLTGIGKPKKYDIVDGKFLKKLAVDLCELGPNKVVITGIVHDKHISNYVYDVESDIGELITKEMISKSYSGTGDIFASILSALIARDFDIFKSCEIASDFLEKTIRYTGEFDTDRNHGVFFEYFLAELCDI